MKRTVLKMALNGEYRVIYDDAQKTNPYRIMYGYWADGHRHTKQVNKYRDFSSCLYYLYDIASKAGEVPHK